MERNPELESMIAKDPTNPAPYLVYADWLQSKGDPRGELITLQHAGKTKEAKAHLDEHSEEILGPLTSYRKCFDGTDQDAFEFRYGFIRAARLSLDTNDVVADGEEEPTLEKAVEALLTHPAGMFLEQITIPINMLDDGCYFEPVLQAIAKHGAPHLKYLRIGEFNHAGPGSANTDYDYEISWAGVGDVSALWKAIPKLERLVIQSGLGSSSLGNGDVIGPIDLPNLRHLEVITGGMSQDNVLSFANAKWPELRHMDLWFGSENYGFSGDVEDLAPIFDAKALPRLEHLGLMNAEHADAICKRLASSKIAAQITELSLAYGTMGDEGAAALAGGKFPKLKKLIVDRSYLSAKGLEALEKICPGGVSAEELRTDEGDDARYVALSE